MNFLHGQNIVHGNLTTSSCKVDSHFTVKITNWEYVVLYKAIRQTAKFKNNADPSKTVLAYFKKNTSPDTFICAPELINGGQYGEPTRAADVYNFGFIVEEIFKLDASNEDSINADDISTFDSDASPGDSKLMPNKARQIVSLARCTETIKRPTFEQLEKALRSAVSRRGGSLIDR
jgi:serine/threonine protein kinase